MPHDTPLITTLVSGLCLAFLFGAIANRLRISPLVGYLLAGVISGPHTPGFYADPKLANELAEIGVILLMFGVGLHFSLKDLLSVKGIAVPGAIMQIFCTTSLGTGLGLVMGWQMSASVVFGLALSTASTVVLLRSLQQRHLLESERGRTTVGWLVVEDLVMVLALVLLPALAGLMGGNEVKPTDLFVNWFNLGIWGIIGLTIAKVIIFIALMMVVGRRVIPWLLKISAQTGSRELFRLAVLAIALGVAFGAAHLFGVSLALGAFFAGMIMGESELSHRAAEDTLPLRDAFAVLFFVSVGMLFNPIKLVTDFIPVFATLLIILVGKQFFIFVIVKLILRQPIRMALTIAPGLAQIGEFSFILAGLGVSLGLISEDARDLILGGAILSILLNPLAFIIADKIKDRLERQPVLEDGEPLVTDIVPDEKDDILPTSEKTGHVILIGYNQVGQLVATALQQKNMATIVIDEANRLTEKARGAGFESFSGNASEKEILMAANIVAAKKLVLTMHSTFEAGQIVAQARMLSEKLHIVAHALSNAEAQYLTDLGANIVVTDAQEIANGMIAYLAGERNTVPEATENEKAAATEIDEYEEERAKA